MPSSILIVDDEPKFCEILARNLTRDGHQTQSCTDPQAALELLRQQPFDFLLTDLRMPGLSGIDLITEAKRLHPNIDAVMLTAYATPDTAIEAMKLGALDYLTKPYEMGQLRQILSTAEATRVSGQDDGDGDQEESTDEIPVSVPLPAKLDITPDADRPISSATVRRSGPDDPVAQSQVMLDLIARASKVAATNSSVLISGESGTGKEVLARHIHGRSKRAKKPLVVVNCGAIPESLIESELFGHVRGAFTGAVESRRGYFEAADQGTLFLDEIGELPLHLQVKLLRALQDGHVQRVGDSKPIRVDVRVLAATNRNLEQSVASGAFRQDLFFRLNVIPMHLSPLRERPEDVDALAEHFLARYASAQNRKLKLSAEARRLLLRYDYPGNVRELENAIEHATVMAEGSQIQPEDLPDRISLFTGRSAVATGPEVMPGGAFAPPQPLGGQPQFGPGGANWAGYPPGNPGAPTGAWPGVPTPPPGGGIHPQTLEATERQMILDALAANRFNLSRSADYLGITRRTLGYRIRKHGLDQAVEEGKAREYPRRPGAMD
jgi:DNA-binding NtrC family response regulator